MSQTTPPAERQQQAETTYLPLPPVQDLVFDDSWMTETPAACGEIGEFKECEEVTRLEEMRQEEKAQAMAAAEAARPMGEHGVSRSS